MKPTHPARSYSTSLLRLFTLATASAMLSAHGALIAYYDFEDDTLDSSGNGNNGTNNGVSFSSDVSGILSHSTKSGSFDGNDSHVDLGYLGLFDQAQSGGIGMMQRRRRA